MHFKTRRVIASVVVIGAVAAGGAAFTAGNTIVPQTVSYSSGVIDGAQVVSLQYEYSSDGSHITSAAVTLAGNESTSGPDAPYVIEAGFTDGSTNNEDALGTHCDATGAAYNSTAGTTLVNCDFTAGPYVADTDVDSVFTAGSGSIVTPNGYPTIPTTRFNLLVTGNAGGAANVGTN